MKTICCTDADTKAAAEKTISQDNKDYAQSVLRPLHLIERFCQVIEAGDTPPPWMMNFLYHGFACYLGSDRKKSMEACFNIKPKQFKEKPPDNMDEMMESYAMVRYLFGMTHDKVAEVIKLWYAYPHNADTLSQQFKHVYQAALYGDDWTSRIDEEMTVTERASIFLEGLKTDYPAVFEKLKKMKHLFKRNKNHPAFL